MLKWLCNTHKIFETEDKSFLFERVFTREISSQDETRSGMKSSLSMVKCLLLFTHFCRDEISSRDERRMKFHPRMTKRKKDVLRHTGIIITRTCRNVNSNSNFGIYMQYLQQPWTFLYVHLQFQIMTLSFLGNNLKRKALRYDDC